MLYLQAVANHYIMTLPDERYRAVMQAEDFLRELCDPEVYPRLPKTVRDRARHVLRHFPTSWDMHRACELAPEIFQTRMEELHRFVQSGQAKISIDPN